MLSCMLLYSCLMAYRQELQLDRFAIAGNVFPTDFQNFLHLLLYSNVSVGFSVL